MKLYKREKYLSKIRPFYDATDIIKVITGIRRCGKSSLMEIIAEEIIEKGVPKENIIFLDLDKRGFRNVKTAKQLEAVILEAGRAKGLKYLFIDEVQNVEGFEEVLNGFRNDNAYSIFITGSNSYLLSGELVTKLTGRYLEFEIFTLSFDEYEGIKKFYHKPTDSNLVVELNKYILESGFPRAIQIDEISAKRTYVEEIVREIFDKDIKRKVKIRDKRTFEIVQNYIINNFGATMSINNICEGLIKNGVSVSRSTISRYIRILLDAKVLYECDRFDMKSKRSLVNEKKYYLADLGIYYAMNTDNRINYGPNLENIVYIYAKSFDYKVSVGRIGKLECDFILRNNNNDYSYLQVAYTIALNKETEDREYRPLEMIRDNYEKYVVTTDFILQKRNGIHHVNLMEFMVNQKQF